LEGSGEEDREEEGPAANFNGRTTLPDAIGTLWPAGEGKGEFVSWLLVFGRWSRSGNLFRISSLEFGVWGGEVGWGEMVGGMRAPLG
jgi:hypothetical protein